MRKFIFSLLMLMILLTGCAIDKDTMSNENTFSYESIEEDQLANSVTNRIVIDGVFNTEDMLDICSGLEKSTEYKNYDDYTCWYYNNETEIDGLYTAGMVEINESEAVYSDPII